MTEKTEHLLQAAFNLLEEIVTGQSLLDSEESPHKQLDMRLKAATTLLGKLAMLEEKADHEEGVYLSKQDIEDMRAAMLRKLNQLADQQFKKESEKATEPTE